MINSKIIGERIREAREKSELSQRALADKLGIAQPYICAMEKGLRKPNLDMVAALSEVLGTSADYLLGKGE